MDAHMRHTHTHVGRGGEGGVGGSRGEDASALNYSILLGACHGVAFVEFLWVT